MKILLLIILAALLYPMAQASDDTEAKQFAEDNSCDVGDKEVVVCAVIMCEFGLLFGEWDRECTKHKWRLMKWASNPFRRLPKCFNRDSNCDKNGGGKSVEVSREDCVLMATRLEKETCELALDPDIDWSKVDPYDGPLKPPYPQPNPPEEPDVPEVPKCPPRKYDCHLYDIP